MDRKELMRRLRATSVESGLLNCHHKGAHSLIVDTRPDGSLTRIFFTTPEHGLNWLYDKSGHMVLGAHNHDKALSFTTLYGSVYNVEFAVQMTVEKGGWKGFMYEFKSSALLTGGFSLGDPQPCSATVIWSPIDGKRLETSDIHTVVVPLRSAAWLVEEGPKQDVQKWILSPRNDLTLDATDLYQPMNDRDIGAACNRILSGMESEERWKI